MDHTTSPSFSSETIRATTKVKSELVSRLLMCLYLLPVARPNLLQKIKLKGFLARVSHNADLTSEKHSHPHLRLYYNTPPLFPRRLRIQLQGLFVPEQVCTVLFPRIFVRDSASHTGLNVPRRPYLKLWCTYSWHRRYLP